MREEDEIRAAVIALAEAQEAGEDVSGELPHGEVAVEAAAPLFDAEASEDEQRDAAIALVMDAVRQATRESRLARPCEWEDAGLVPPAMTAEDLEMAVYDALMEHGEPVPEGAAEAGEGPAQTVRPANKHVRSAFSSSNGRCVGASPFKHQAALAKEEPANELESLVDFSATEELRGGTGCPDRASSSSELSKMEESSGDDGRSDRASSAATGTAQWAVPSSEDCLSESECPSPPPEASDESDSLPYDCKNIRLLMGRESYYLYDASAMTDAYARWSFLAAEEDPVATFVECVREESSVYPRPMARTNLANDPFRLSAEAVEAAFAEARAQGRADDIERTEASNGDVYFYSTTYLSPVRARSLAEWDAVERRRNV
ncbi:hypothetical protein VJ923_06325 [Adlercreutzia sp. R25]|uniref:Uncharacterized protein n=1 Tax=Adlercreutzia shanghongiae TaxID=3111773 RepID=A0ABU6IZ55_9ACTN|nr:MULTISPECIES: hypothetical protein [unclassified Adlercreutzia]MEC4272769.1 hypothetical protein [Adlercreutzia sp. R25]MEC4295113.1 hypothetical protein [Adlercreutzia sp. R22]